MRLQCKITVNEQGEILCMLMITLELCRQVLNKNGKKEYTDKDIERIREFLYRVGEIQIEVECKINK